MENKEESGVRTDIPLKDFEKYLAPDTPKMKRQRVFLKVKGVLDFFGIIDESSSASGSGGINTSTTSSSSQSFRASYHAEPQQRTHEQWVMDEMAHEAYHKMVDGKGDHDCDHEH